MNAFVIDIPDSPANGRRSRRKSTAPDLGENLELGERPAKVKANQKSVWLEAQKPRLAAKRKRELEANEADAEPEVDIQLTKKGRGPDSRSSTAAQTVRKSARSSGHKSRSGGQKPASVGHQRKGRMTQSQPVDNLLARQFAELDEDNNEDLIMPQSQPLLATTSPSGECAHASDKRANQASALDGTEEDNARGDDPPPTRFSTTGTGKRRDEEDGKNTEDEEDQYHGSADEDEENYEKGNDE
ncbi:hypothetical protein K474DRAFT_1712164, partial [Panus rudis PR-1116 ss-1]